MKNVTPSEASAGTEEAASRRATILIWTFRVYIGIAFLVASWLKLSPQPILHKGVIFANFNHWWAHAIAVLEIALVIALLVPRTAGLAALMLLFIAIGALIAQLTFYQIDLIHPVALIIATLTLLYLDRRNAPGFRPVRALLRGFRSRLASDRITRIAVAAATACVCGTVAYSFSPPSYAQHRARFAGGRGGQECLGYISDGGPIHPRAEIEKRLPPGFAFGITRAELLPRLRAAGFESRAEPYDGLEHFTISPRYAWLKDFSQSTGLKPSELLIAYTKSDDPSLAEPYAISIVFQKSSSWMSSMPSIVRNLGSPTSGSYSRSCDPEIDDASYLSAPETLPQFGIAASDCVMRDPERSSCVTNKAVGTCAFRPQHPDQLVMNVRTRPFKEGITIQFVDVKQSAPLFSGKLPNFTTVENQPLQYCRFLKDPFTSR